MSLGTAFSSEITKNAAVAYIHYLSFMICFAALALERKLLQSEINKNEAISLVIIDVFYGLAGLALLASGVLRVLYFGQGSSFYTENPVFWIKVAIFIFVGLLSLYPTFTYIVWVIPIARGDFPSINLSLVNRLRFIVNIELIGFALIPIFATIMARGIKI